MTARRPAERETFTPAEVRQNALWMSGMLGALGTIAATVLAASSGAITLLGALGGTYLASLLLRRREPPPFGSRNTRLPAPDFLFTEEFRPVREKLKAGIDAVRSPLLVALWLGVVWIAASLARGGEPGPFERGFRNRPPFLPPQTPAWIFAAAGDAFSAALAGLFSLLGACGWSWLSALRKTPFAIGIIAAVFMAGPAWAGPYDTAINNGVAYLQSSQTAAGSWGPGVTSYRDTGEAVLTLLLLNQAPAERARALAYLRGAPTPSNDHLARRILALAPAGDPVTSSVSTLRASARPAGTDPSRPNYPEGGWGLRSGHGSDVADTVLAMAALKAAGQVGGLTVAGQAIAAGGNIVFRVQTSPDAIRLRILLTALTGAAVDVRIRQGTDPTLADPFFHITAVPVQIVLPDSGLPFTPGDEHIRLDCPGGSPCTVSMEVSYETPSYDTRDLKKPINYLLAAQNGDGSWGPAKGRDGLLFLTAAALVGLQDYATAFNVTTSMNSAASYLAARQNGNGGWGSDAGVSSPRDTALVLLALERRNPADPQLTTGKNYLIANQSGNGSWGSDPYQTALAVRALKGPPLDPDGDGVPDYRDNCVAIANPTQDNHDADAVGDACDADDDNDGINDVGGTLSTTPMLISDVTSITTNIPAQPVNSYINVQVLTSPTATNLGWVNLNARNWIDASAAPSPAAMIMYVDASNPLCGCIDLPAGGTITFATNAGSKIVYLPDLPAGAFGWLYVASDGSTYFDQALTSLAQGAPVPPGDNCRIVYNPTQTDGDADKVGDVCDNCAAVYNPTQTDGDLDGVGSSCDCAAADGGAYGVPVELGTVTVAKTGILMTLSWPASMGAGSGASYDIVTGSIAALRTAGGYSGAACLVRMHGAATFTDPRIDPPTGVGYYYLLRARTTCGGGTYGNSDETPDPRDALDSASPCP